MPWVTRPGKKVSIRHCNFAVITPQMLLLGRQKLYILFFFLLAHMQVTGMPAPYLRSRIFTIEQGLTGSEITVVFQDSYGFLWIGAKNGLNRYDGYRFRNYRARPGQQGFLAGNYIYSITEDKLGNLWIVTSRGLSRYIRENDVFDSPSLGFLPRVPGLRNNVLNLIATRQGELCMLTHSGILLWDPVMDSLNMIQGESLYTGDFRLGEVPPMIRNPEGLIWAGGHQALIRFNPRTGNMRNFPFHPEPRSETGNYPVRALYEASGQLWVGTEKGLFTLEKGGSKPEPVLLSGNNADLSQTKILSITGDKQGRIWIGTPSGLYIYDPSTRKTESITYLDLPAGRAPLTQVRELYIDRSEIVWIGTMQGLIKNKIKRPNFISYNNRPGSVPEMSGNQILSIWPRDSLHIWLGIAGGGLNIVNRSNSRVREYHPNHTLPDRRINNNMVYTIHEDSAGRIFLGTGDGINVMLPGENKFRRFCQLYDGIPCNLLQNNAVYALEGIPSGLLWIGTERGLFSYDFRTLKMNEHTLIPLDDTLIRLRSVYDIVPNRDGSLWLATSEGLMAYNADHQSNQWINLDRVDRPGQASPVYTIQKTGKDILWAGTSNYLAKYNLLTEEMILIEQKHDIHFGTVQSLISDRHGCLWMSSNHGIFRVDTSKIYITHFDLSDGLISLEFSRGAAYAADWNELFFGGDDGFSVVCPDSLLFNEHVPQLAFTNLLIHSEDGDENVPVIAGNEILISHEHNLFTLEFAAMDFTYPLYNRYYYSMVKRDDPPEWIYLGNRHSVTFSNLPSGAYRFTLRGSNNDGIWNQEGIDLYFRVTTPLWLSRKAYIFYVLFLGGIIYIGVAYRTRNLRRANRILREKELAAREVAHQKELLTIKNKNITDSMNYARRIQEALIPSDHTLKRVFPESFILHRSKDIVSGDFYWIGEDAESLYVANVDCTGHGIPGAFMSILGFELFRQVVIQERYNDPGKILKKINENFHEIFFEAGNVMLNDGMDVAFCVFHKKHNSVSFAGAFNPLYLIRDNSLIEYKGEKFSVGVDPAGYVEKNFRTHHIDLKEGDVLYTFTDGYVDQFGGPEGKKFKYRRLRHLLLTIHQFPMNKQFVFLEKTLEDWRGNIDQIDDILIIGIRV